MSKRLTFSAAFVMAVWSLVAAGVASAQEAPGNAQVRQPRPQNADLQVQNLPPELEQLLQAWSQKSAQVQKLQGRHLRQVFNLVFNVEKRSMGVFYYEAPGKGRIDLTPAPIKEGDVSKKVAQNGKPFKLQSDRPEKWICDGKDIWQVNDQAKQVDIFTIPQENQGQNIMDGPMPFLFGMPPDKAKRRYVLQLVNETPERATIKVLPRWQVDAANWQEAWVNLDKRLYLPTEVKLVDPSGNLETIYRFGEFHINKEPPNWFIAALGIAKDDPDPFRPKLKGYTFKVHTVSENAGGDFVPSLAGLGWNDAKNLLENLKCQVKISQGQKAPNGALTYVVYQQNPAPKTPLKPGQLVELMIYAPIPVPGIVGLHWTEAGQKLEAAGFKPKYLRGKIPPDEAKLYIAYEQSPAAGQPSTLGGEVEVTVYNKAEQAMK